MSGQTQIPPNYPHILVNESLPILPVMEGGGDLWRMKVPTPVFLTRMLRQSDLESVHQEDTNPQGNAAGEYINWCRSVFICKDPYKHSIMVRVIRAGDLALGTDEIFQCQLSMDPLMFTRDNNAGAMLTRKLQEVDSRLGEQGCCPLGNSEIEFIMRVIPKVIK